MQEVRRNVPKSTSECPKPLAYYLRRNDPNQMFCVTENRVCGPQSKNMRLLDSYAGRHNAVKARARSQCAIGNVLQAHRQ